MFTDHEMILYGATKKAQNYSQSLENALAHRNQRIKELEDRDQQWAREYEQSQVNAKLKDLEIQELKLKVAALEENLINMDKTRKSLLCSLEGFKAISQELIGKVYSFDKNEECLQETSAWGIATRKALIGEPRSKIWDVYEKKVRECASQLKINLSDVGKII